MIYYAKMRNRAVQVCLDSFRRLRRSSAGGGLRGFGISDWFCG